MLRSHLEDPNLDCKTFLQLVLPVLNRRWAGYRKVKSQVCKRVKRRAQSLKLANLSEYWEYLQKNPHEWKELDACCDITISRFYRDHDVFDFIKDEIFPALVETYKDGAPVRIWSAGCCSGEEPYTISLICAFTLPKLFSQFKIQIVATDRNQELLQKAQRGCYKSSSLRELPENWKQVAFELDQDQYCLKGSYRKPVEFLKQDIRSHHPPGTFKLVLCRNLVAMYFDSAVQEQVFKEIGNRLEIGGYLILGKHEILPPSLQDFELHHEHFRIYRKC